MDSSKGKEKANGGLGGLLGLANWISDWHLLYFLDGLGIFESVRFSREFFRSLS